MKEKKRFLIYQNRQFVKDYAYLGDAKNAVSVLRTSKYPCDFCIYDSYSCKVVWEYDSKLNTIRRYA